MDAALLEIESPTMHLHVMGVLVLDPSTSDGSLSPQRIFDLFTARLHLIPPFRLRAVSTPGGLDHARWIVDPDFELARHLEHRDLGPDAGQEAMEAFVGEVASVPLPRDRPLWKCWLLDGFADGTVALVTKMHHALMDGSASGDLMASLFDLEPNPPTEVPEEILPVEGEPVPGWARLLLEASGAAVQRAARVPGILARTVSGFAGSAKAIAAQPSSLAAFAPASPFNGPLSPARSVSFGCCSLADVKEIRQVYGTTVNDVVLAATALSLRRYLLAHDIEPLEPLVASVPTAPARTQEDPAFGNRTSNMMVALPVQLDEPGEILRAVQRDTVGAKATRQALSPDVMNDWVTLFPAALLSGGAKVYSELRLGRLHPPLFNAIVSNVAGPPIPLYLAGARVTGIYPMGPLIANTGLNLTVLSRTGDLDVGVIACPDLIPDVSTITQGFIDAIQEMLLAAREPGAGD